MTYITGPTEPPTVRTTETPMTLEQSTSITGHTEPSTVRTTETPMTQEQSTSK